MSISADIVASAADRLRIQIRTSLWHSSDRIGWHLTLVHACLLPKRASNFDGIDAGGFPPGAFVARAMHGPVMHATERDREFIACFAAQRAWLPALAMILMTALVLVMAGSPASIVLLFGLALFAGFCGQDLVRWSVARRGFLKTTLVAGRNE